MTDLSIITLSRNVDYFRRLVAALRDSPIPFQGVLVNNANSMHLTSSALLARWLTIEPGYNTTFAEGNNLGAKVSDGHWLLLLNDDVIPTESFLERLWTRRKEASVLGALLLHENSTVNHAGTRVWPSGATDHIGRNDARLRWECETAPAVPSVTFAAALVNANTFKELGGLDERYHYGWEDTDLCLRVLRAGGTIRCVRDAVAFHDECGTRPRGGAADAENQATFLGTWQQELPALLADYVKRMRPERVEGIA